MADPPDPDRLHPIPGVDNTVLLRPLLARHPEIRNVSVGLYSYYSDFDDPLRFFTRNIRYNFGLSGARLTIGNYCAIGHGATFVMPDANHAMAGPSTFPFGILGGAFAEALPLADYPWRGGGDIVIGHDVWIGYGSTILPGVCIGHGAVIGAGAMVTRDVPDYAIMGGNPAQVLRRRFDDATIAALLALNWWDWPAARVARAVPLLVKGDVAALAAMPDG